MSNYFFEVLRPGINTTFQDKGRFYMQHLGVTPGGCMDLESFSIANALVGNISDTGVLEFAYQGPLLKLIKGRTKIAITGNVLFQIIKTNQETINGECNRTYALDEGDQIDILSTKQSAYGYMALEGGFNIKSFCKSVSILSRAEIGPNEGQRIKINDAGNVFISTPITNAFYGLSLTYNNTNTADFTVNQATGQIKIGGTAAGYFPTFYSAGTERMRITSGGEIQFTGNGVIRNEISDGNYSYWYQSASEVRFAAQYAQPLTFYNSGAERMRIDSSGYISTPADKRISAISICSQ